MGWIEAQMRYKKGETLTDQKTEDLVARRVLRGLGFVAKHVPELERALGLKDTYDLPLWPRTLEILRLVAIRSDKPQWFGHDAANPGIFSLELRDSDVAHRAILELIPMLELHASLPYPLFLTRVKDTQVSLAYYLMPHDVTEANVMSLTASWLRPPVQFIAEAGPWWIAVQETEHFIRQFGPYKSPLAQNE